MHLCCRISDKLIDVNTLFAYEIDLEELSDWAYSAVFADVCDKLGFRNTSVGRLLAPRTGSGVLVGWARTAKSQAVSEPPLRHYGAEIDYIDSLKPGDVVVASVDGTAAFWGELFSAAATGRGCRGAVIDGFMRDETRVSDVGFPVWAKGALPTDSLGRISISQQDVEIAIDGVPVSRGDLVIADSDGVTIVPAAIAIRAIEEARQKASTETAAKATLMAGATLKDVWEKYRVL